MSHITYPEAAFVGLLQGITELFPVSSLGHSVLIPALVGGSWATDLNIASSKSAYLAFIVGLHVATALGILIYFWRDWLRIIGGFLSSIRDRHVETVDQKLAWMIIIATIPVGLVGALAQHKVQELFAKPIRAAIFLVINGLILFAAERFRTRASRQADEDLERQREQAQGHRTRTTAAHASGQRAARQEELSQAVQSDTRLSKMGYLRALVIGSVQILALLAGISRDGVSMVAGLFSGLSREDAARFAFLLATPVILAAGVLKVPDLFGQEGNGIGGQILVGSLLSGIGAYVSVRFLVRYFQTRTLTPFAVYCVAFGLASAIYLQLR
ncbi:MAG TPA: undecaprenyl-diphosphate phosphatase [Streptosporangiaceae bacterium]|jgi:undecaprenyl-diphosphatase